MIVGKPTKIPKEVQKGLLNPELYKVQSIDDGIFLILKSRWSCILGKI